MMSPSEALAKLLTDDDHWFYLLVLQLQQATCGGCIQMVTWETMAAVLVHCCGSMLAYVVQIATLLQNVSRALLLLAGSGAASHKGRS